MSLRTLQAGEAWQTVVVEQLSEAGAWPAILSRSDETQLAKTSIYKNPCQREPWLKSLTLAHLGLCKPAQTEGQQHTPILVRGKEILLSACKHL